jgi:hypothetical protein
MIVDKAVGIAVGAAIGRREGALAASDGLLVVPCGETGPMQLLKMHAIITIDAYMLLHDMY